MAPHEHSPQSRTPCSRSRRPVPVRTERPAGSAATSLPSTDGACGSPPSSRSAKVGSASACSFASESAPRPPYRSRIIEATHDGRPAGAPARLRRALRSLLETAYAISNDDKTTATASILAASVGPGNAIDRHHSHSRPTSNETHGAEGPAIAARRPWRRNSGPSARRVGARRLCPLMWAAEKRRRTFEQSRSTRVRATLSCATRPALRWHVGRRSPARRWRPP